MLFFFKRHYVILSSKTTVFRSVPFLRSSVRPKFYIQLALPISPEIMDGFWCSRCLNDRIDLLYMIGSFASGANVSLVAKNWTKKIIPLLWIKSSKKPQIKKFHKTDPPKVEILIQNTILKFSKTKNQSHKRPTKVPKNQKHI